jgi:hypothetical protein
MKVEVLVTIDNSVGLYHVEGQNVNYVSCSESTIDKALEGFLDGLSLTHKLHEEHGFKTTKLFTDNPYKVLNKFDDNVKEYIIEYKGV